MRMKTPHTVIITCSYCGKQFPRYLSQTISRKTGLPWANPECPDCKVIPPEVRFWSKVDKTSSPNGCWLWTAGVNADGYPNFPYPKIGEWRGNRISWTLIHGRIPDNIYVLHKCPGTHNRLCVNPDHLYLGTQSDNMKDAVEQGTLNRPTGEDHYHSLLTEEAVCEIRSRYAELAKHHNVKELSTKYAVSLATIRDVAKRRSWKHIQ